MAGIVIIVGSISLPFSISYFKIQKCQIYIEEYGRDSVNGMGCDYLFQPIVESLAIYLTLVLVPVLAGIILIIYVRTGNWIGENVYDSSLARFLIVTLLLLPSLTLVGFMILGFGENDYFLGTRCPPNVLANMNEDPRGEACSLILKVFEVRQLENFTNLALSAAWMIPAGIHFVKAFGLKLERLKVFLN